MYKVQIITDKSQVWIPVDVVEAYRVAALHIIDTMTAFEQLNDGVIDVIETPEHRIRLRELFPAQRPQLQPDETGEVLWA